MLRKTAMKNTKVSIFFYKTLLGLIGRRRPRSRRAGKRVLGGSEKIHHREVTAACWKEKWIRGWEYDLSTQLCHQMWGTGNHPILDLIFLDLKIQKSGVDNP